MAHRETALTRPPPCPENFSTNSNASRAASSSGANSVSGSPNTRTYRVCGKPAISMQAAPLDARGLRSTAAPGRAGALVESCNAIGLRPSSAAPALGSHVLAGFTRAAGRGPIPNRISPQVSILELPRGDEPASPRLFRPQHLKKRSSLVRLFRWSASHHTQQKHVIRPQPHRQLETAAPLADVLGGRHLVKHVTLLADAADLDCDGGLVTRFVPFACIGGGQICLRQFVVLRGSHLFLYPNVQVKGRNEALSLCS